MNAKLLRYAPSGKKMDAGWSSLCRNEPMGCSVTPACRAALRRMCEKSSVERAAEQLDVINIPPSFVSLMAARFIK